MTNKAASIIIRLTCLAVLTASLSGCIIYVGKGHHLDPSGPEPRSDEKPAQTGSF